MNTNFKKYLVTGTIAIAALGGSIAANELFNKAPTATQESATSKAATPRTENFSFKEGANYTVLDIDKLTPIYEKLGMNAHSSYEVFSYTCIHCYNLEGYLPELVDGIDDFHHIQLGFDNFPIAQTHYILEKSLSVKPKLYQSARLELYKVMQFQNLTFEQKVEALKKYPHARAISEEEIEYLTPEAEKYSKASRELAIAMDLEGTPTLVIDGKYKLSTESIHSEQEFKALVNYVYKLDASEHKSE